MNFYRIQTQIEGSYYGDCDLLSSDVRIVFLTFIMLKETEKGYWISLSPNDSSKDGHWVSKTSKKKYAYPSKEEAMNDFINRTKKRISILEEQTSNCKIALSKAEIIKSL